MIFWRGFRNLNDEEPALRRPWEETYRWRNGWYRSPKEGATLLCRQKCRWSEHRDQRGDWKVMRSQRTTEADLEGSCRLLHWFPVVAVTNYHKFCGSNDTIWLSYGSVSQESDMGLTGLQPRGRQSCIPFCGPWRRISPPCPFWLSQAILIPWLLSPTLCLQTQKCCTSLIIL